jgi:hypothetical protein
LATGTILKYDRIHALFCVSFFSVTIRKYAVNDVAEMA